MFEDKCGYNKRTHLIFSYKGKNVLKKADLPYKQDPAPTHRHILTYIHTHTHTCAGARKHFAHLGDSNEAQLVSTAVL
eukprot:3545518-Amphidinium_carterae.1